MQMITRFLQLPRQVHYILLGVLCTNLGAYMVIPFFTIYFTHQIKLALSIIGIAFTVQIIAQRGFSLVSGFLTDKYHAKLTLLAGLFFNAAAYLGLSFANNAFLLIVFAGFLGLGNAFFNPASKVAILNLILTDHRAFALSIRNTAMNIGVACGPLLGGLLLGISTQFVFWMTSFIYVAFFLVFLRYITVVIPERPIQKVRLIHSFALLSHPVILSLIGMMVFFMMGYMQMDLTMPLVANALQPRWGVVYIFALNSLTVSLLAIPIVNWLISPHKTIRMIYVSITLLVISLVLFGIAKNIFVALFAMFLFSIAEILFFPSLDTTLSEQCPPGFTGRSFGLLDMGGALGGTLGNLAGGFFYPMLSKQHGSYYWIALALIIMLFSNGIMLLLAKHARRIYQLAPGH